MAYEKILILESTWALDSDDYIRDSRSTARIYLSFESLLSLHDEPVFAVHRPLLSARYLHDIRQFVSLPANAKGLNVVILSAHGSFTRVRKGNRLVNRRRLHAIDGEVKLSSDVHRLKDVLRRTVFVLDACDVGSRVAAFRSAAGALGVIGFSKSVDWVDSAAFVLALLLHMQSGGVFQQSRASSKQVERVVNTLRRGPYKSLAEALGLEVAWATQHLSALPTSRAQIFSVRSSSEVQAGPLSRIPVAFSFSAVFVPSAGTTSMTRYPTPIEARPSRCEGRESETLAA